ncbi:sensor histidine kinase [Streptomyces paludis]|uniref:histidine kinase n=1 Tax=Streptomyces paludis TaxID=2282738 RepID=A0A345HRG6_9ACTN|nr:histidine kinase [Streptomyces paludis]AXG79290.1 two-component sensor histidine kinase [Streptomyces paludis]
MTETTTGETRSPEFHLAARAFAGLRQDLIHDAFAYRPLRPLRTLGPFDRVVPRRIRALAAWVPHAVVVFGALMVFAVAMGSAGPVFALMITLPVLLTMARPVGAWWLALGVSGAVSILTFGGWPWTAGTFAGYLVVIAIVGARTRPRVAVWMWLITAAYSLFAGIFFDRGYSNVGSAVPMLFLSAIALLSVSMVHVRREAEHQVAEQQSVTAVERGRRTLLEERTTIARELHDVVAHHMSVVAIQAEAAPYRVENPPPELEQAFVTIRENAVAALTELRRILGVVRADDYEAPDAPQPTLAELDGLLDNVRDAGLTVEKTVTGSVRELPPGVELSAYRIVQEALSNALRHAPGATARVEISYVLGGLGLRIVNTAPRGLVKPSPGAGHGITGMRERVSMLNGEMTAEPTEDGGYEVAAFIPVALVRDTDRDGDKGKGGNA